LMEDYHMGRGIQQLTLTKVRTAKPPEGRRAILVADGGGLYLQCSRGDGEVIRKSWIFRFTLPGRKPRDAGLGSLDTIDLDKAREVAREYRALVREGHDPIEKAKAAKLANLAATATVMTVDECIAAYIRKEAATWTNQAHADQWKNSMRDYVSPIIGKLNVRLVDTPQVLRVLQQDVKGVSFWEARPETASRVRQRLEKVLGWAQTSGHRDPETLNPARWPNHLQNLLAKASKLKAKKHQPALDWREMPGFVSALRKVDSVAARGLVFCAATGVRTADILDARVAHIDRKAKLWTIPKFSKTKREHRVPLTPLALALLAEVDEIRPDGSDFLFPGETGGEMYDQAMLRTIETIGYKGRASVHGLRASFRTWAGEQTNFPREVCEMALGHTVGSEVERAYARGELLRKREQLMAAWSNFLAKPIIETNKDNVITLSRTA
jgi:integrase